MSTVAYVIYQPFLTIYHHFINPAWLDYMTDFHKRRMIAANMPQMEIDQRLAQIISGSNDMILAINGLIFGVLVLGFVISTISSLFLKRWKKQIPTS